MKKTLFMVLVFSCFAGSASAAIPEDSKTNGDYQEVVDYDTGKKNGTHTLIGNVIFTENELAPGDGGHAVTFGSPEGNARVVLEEGVTFSAPNSFFVGGAGYKSHAPLSGSAVLVMKPGSVVQVAQKSTSTGASHVDVGNSKNPCRGELYMDHATLTAAQLLVGSGNAEGYVLAKNGSTINLSNTTSEGTQLTGNQWGLLLGYANGDAKCTGTLVLDNSNIVDSLTPYYDTKKKEWSYPAHYIGAYGDGSLELKNGASMQMGEDSDMFIGESLAAWGYHGSADVLIGEGCSMTGGWSINTYDKTTLVNNGTMSATLVSLCGGDVTNGQKGEMRSDNLFEVVDGTSFVNNGTLQAGNGMKIDGAEFTNNGTTVVIGETAIKNGASVYNKGMLDAGGDEAGVISLGGGVTFVTGTVTVSGCESAMAESHAMDLAFVNGLGSGDRISIAAEAGESLTVGSYVEGAAGTTQHLYSSDFASVDGYIRDNLPIEPTEATLNVTHILGKNITANVTTDEASHDGGVTLALSGSKLVVRVGDNGAETPTEDDRKASAEKVGTLGSYMSDAAETTASVRLHETAENSSIAWEGHYMTTVANEEATINDTTAVSIGNKTENIEGTLTVVETSTLKNHGEVSTNVVEVNGTLDNNGAITADETKVAQGAVLKGSGSIVGNTVIDGTLVVGNSPGQQNFTGDVLLGETAEAVFSIGALSDTPADASSGLVGWDAAVNSQIVIADGALTLTDGVAIRVEFGGDAVFNDKLLSFGTYTVENISLTLVSGGCAEVDAAALTACTTLTMTDELAGQPVLGGDWSIEFGDFSWAVQGADLVLHIDSVTVSNPSIVPEPATATLSLLALAGLAARRKRRA